MAAHDLSPWTHTHRFGASNPAAERGTRAVLWITLVMMALEIAGGTLFNSMALLADGWHMSSHALAIGLASFAYGAARRYADDPRFAFGSWKIEVLAGYTSALFLLGIAAMMVIESVQRLLSPSPIQYQEAMAVALVGLIVNLACACILGHAHDHPHEHGHGHAHHGHAHAHGGSDGKRPSDLNLKAAYIHVVTDAATSVLAIVALAGGWRYGWAWLDPATGLLGAGLVAWWARGLLVESGRVLLDREMDHPVVDEIREVIAALPDGDAYLTDLHVWRVGRNAYACTVTVLTHDHAVTAEQVRASLAEHEELVHITVEIQHCDRCD